ncbi:MAG TPA: AAA family ATPase [Micromonosporaceae bacterium]|nr:AAA family ATPase [Micromonosporaceae bacterium]
MIIWINGAFGAGKTTLSEELHQRLPEALAFDPEYVGFLLREWVPAPESGDFQDIPLWRTLVAQFAIGLHREYGRTLIVPMTLVNVDYRDEIFELLTQAGVPVLHVFIDVPAAELRRRIEEQVLVPDDAQADGAARAFRLANIERCLAARTQLSPDTTILCGSTNSPDQLADQVMQALGRFQR